MDLSDFKTSITNAIGYWEPRRLLFNLALAVVVVFHFVAGLPLSTSALSFDLGLNFFILAVLANVLFTSAYVPDLAMQFSGYREFWLKNRWILLLLGTTFACAVANFFARAMFGNAP
jgi:hypothetical protein